MNDGAVVMPGCCTEQRDQISERLGALELGNVFIMGLDL